MKVSFWFSIFFLASLTLNGQHSVLRQLLSLKDDTTKVEKLAVFAKEVVAQNQQLSREATVALLQLSKQLHYSKGIGTGYSYLGYFDINEGKYSTATAYYKEAVKHYKEANDLMGVAKCLGNLADIFQSMGLSDSAITLRLSAISTLENLQAFPTAVNPILTNLSFQYHNLAVLYISRLQNIDKALFYFRKAETAARQAKDTFMLVYSLNGIAIQLADKGESEKAFVIAREAFQISKRTENNQLLAKGYECYGYCLSALGQGAASESVLRNAVKFAWLSKSVDDIMPISVSLAKVLSKREEYGEVIKVLQPVYHKVVETGTVEYNSDIEKQLAQAYYHLGKFKSAYEHLEKHVLFKDSLIILSNNNIIAEKDAKYQAAQKEKVIAQKQLQLQRSQHYTILGFALSVGGLLSVTLLVVYYKNKRRLHQKQLHSLHQEKEIQLLYALMQGEEKERNRIAKDLHDGIAGMLAAAKMHLNVMAHKNKPLLGTIEYCRTVALLDETHQEVRKTSHNLMPEVLLKYGLDEALHRYCAAISNEALQVIYVSIGEIGPYEERFELAIYRIIQELLGNTIKHAQATEVQVQLSSNEGTLLIEVEDNGVGFSSASDLTSIGLKSLQTRVAALGGTIAFESRKNGLSVNVELATSARKRK